MTSGTASGLRYIFRDPLARMPLWHLVDATGHSVGRLSSQIARLLMGKHKPIYDPSKDCGDYVVVVNAEKVNFTGKKWDQKLYRWHTGYPGGLKEMKAKDMVKRHPTSIIEHAVKGMVPKNNLRNPRLDRLKVYTGPRHPHIGQVRESAVRPTSSIARVIPAYAPPSVGDLSIPEAMQQSLGGWSYTFEKGDKEDQIVITETRVWSDKEKAKRERRMARMKRVGEYEVTDYPKPKPPPVREPWEIPVRTTNDVITTGKRTQITSTLFSNELPTSLSDWDAKGAPSTPSTPPAASNSKPEQPPAKPKSK
eukprot:TRINITY_DN7498_c0_g1_i2.p1 TRINITY_DN7498_c0_g1~~TRINITY_DN7498_c0_g1_i2.p1  ORF type:complete len:308 (-),score=52.06 TRINITY_DN7498_c0_g1_i2:8-931(-)